MRQPKQSAKSVDFEINFRGACFDFQSVQWLQPPLFAKFDEFLPIFQTFTHLRLFFYKYALIICNLLVSASLDVLFASYHHSIFSSIASSSLLLYHMRFSLGQKILSYFPMLSYLNIIFLRRSTMYYFKVNIGSYRIFQHRSKYTRYKI